jgi:hypothetical protein
VTLEQVTTPNTVTLRKLVEEHGYEQMLQLVTRVVIEADIMLGGDGDVSRCAPTAANTLTSNGHRGIGFIVLSIREGVKRTDRDGRAFGKINVQLLHEWTGAQEARIIGMAEDEHARVSFKSDNLGADWMNRQQHNSEADKRKIARMSAHIEMLKANLKTEPKP